MKLKTLLMGSAAALIAVSGARAADAVVAEPEPMDYVKVCDMYGAGFFYIPGTETCLKINGYVDVQYEYSSFESDMDMSETDVNESYSTGEPVYLARINFDAREETDYGTLQSYMRVEGSGNNTGGASVSMVDVYINLGGFSTGYKTTALETGGLPGVMLDGYYGGGRHMYANYTFASNGFAVTAGVDLDDGSTFAADEIELADFGDDVYQELEEEWGSTDSNADGDSKSVNPYVVVSYSGSMFTIRGKYGHDTSASEAHYGVDGSITPIDGLTIRGFYEANTGVNEYAASADPTGFYQGVFDDGATPAVVTGHTQYSDYNWGIGASFAVMDNVKISAGYSAMEFQDSREMGDSADNGDIDSYTVGLDWNVTSNLLVRVNYRHQEWDGADNDANVEVDEFRVRVQRSF